MRYRPGKSDDALTLLPWWRCGRQAGLEINLENITMLGFVCILFCEFELPWGRTFITNYSNAQCCCSTKHESTIIQAQRPLVVVSAVWFPALAARRSLKLLLTAVQSACMWTCERLSIEISPGTWWACRHLKWQPLPSPQMSVGMGECGMCCWALWAVRGPEKSAA